MKRCFVAIFVLALILCSTTGCYNNSPTMEDFQKAYYESKGDSAENRTYSTAYDVSDRFDIKINPTKIITKDGAKHIVYSSTIDNKSEEKYKNFSAVIVLSEKMSPYIASGLIILPCGKVDLAAKSDPNPAEAEGRGMDISCEQGLSDEQSMKEMGLSYEDILEYGSYFSLWLRWDGGEEIYNFQSDVIDES